MPRPSNPFDLTPKERDVLDLMKIGKSNKEIQSAFGIGIGTFNKHSRMIREKLQIPEDRETRQFLLANRDV